MLEALKSSRSEGKTITLETKNVAAEHTGNSPIALYPISMDQLNALVSSAVKQQFETYLAPKIEDEFINRRQAAGILKVSLATLNEWGKTGKVKPYRIGSRIRFKKAEVISSLNKVVFE